MKKILLQINHVMSKSTYEKLTWLVSKNLKQKLEGITLKEWQEVLKAWEHASE